MAELKKSLVESKQRVTEVTDAWKKNKDALTENNLKSAIQERELLNQKIKDTESALRQGRNAITGYADELRKTENTGVGTIGGLAKGLAATGIGNMLSGALGGAASEFFKGGGLSARIGMIYGEGEVAGMHEEIAPESIRGEILANLGTEVDWREGRAEAWLPPIWKRNPAKWRRVAG